MAEEAKNPKELTKQECLDELEALEAEGVEFGTKYGAKTPLKTLQKLVKEGRVAAEEDEDEEEDDEENDEEEDSDEDAEDEDEEEDSDEDDEDDEDSDEDEDEDEDEEAEVVTTVPKGKGAHVFDAAGKYVRTYSPKKHGKEYASLAKTFVSKKGRDGYRVKVTK